MSLLTELNGETPQSGLPLLAEYEIESGSGGSGSGSSAFTVRGKAPIPDCPAPH